MRKLAVTTVVLSVAIAFQSVATAQGPFQRLIRQDMANRGDVWAQSEASGRPWHGNYYNVQYGQPVAVVVPPNSVLQQNYSWGVSQNTATPIYHQYGYAATPSSGGAFYGTPIWPSHTNQLGYYPVRGPW